MNERAASPPEINECTQEALTEGAMRVNWPAPCERVEQDEVPSSGALNRGRRWPRFRRKMDASDTERVGVAMQAGLAPAALAARRCAFLFLRGCRPRHDHFVHYVAPSCLESLA